MSSPGTDLGGTSPAFRTTMWSDIVAAGDPGNPGARENLDRLIRTYWKPAFAYLQASWRLSVEDAKDCTQAFFARLLERDSWASISRDKGSFRSYLKGALKYFMINFK